MIHLWNKQVNKKNNIPIWTLGEPPSAHPHKTSSTERDKFTIFSMSTVSVSTSTTRVGYSWFSPWMLDPTHIWRASVVGGGGGKLRKKSATASYCRCLAVKGHQQWRNGRSLCRTVSPLPLPSCQQPMPPPPNAQGHCASPPLSPQIPLSITPTS